MTGFDEDYAREQQRRSRSRLRSFVKNFYLQHVLADVKGPSIDYGCGAGQMLRLLPKGSVGFELNPVLVDALTREGLVVHRSSGSMSDFDLASLNGSFNTLIISHVLEHLVDPASALKRLMAACSRLGVQRIIAVVPGLKGYQSDATHNTFIDRRFADSNFRDLDKEFVLSAVSYFPGNWEWIGRYYVFHEMKLIFDRRTVSG
jgi:hypothetical protein